MRCVIIGLLGAALVAGVASAEPADGRLKTVQETATLRIAYRTDSRPFAFLDGKGKPTGYTIELCERIAKSIERQLGLPSLAIKWVPVDTRTRFEAIVNGIADIECGSSTISLSRLKIVDFSSLIYAESTGVLVKSGQGLFSFDSMAGRKIGIVPGSTNALAIRNELERRKLAATLVEFRDREEGRRGARPWRTRRLCDRQARSAGAGPGVKPARLHAAAGRSLVRALRHRAAAG